MRENKASRRLCRTRRSAALPKARLTYVVDGRGAKHREEMLSCGRDGRAASEKYIASEADHALHLPALNIIITVE